MANPLIKFPHSPFVDPKQPSGISREWFQWLQNPSFLTFSAPIDATQLTSGTLNPARLPVQNPNPGTWGSSSSVPVFSVTAEGIITSIANVGITIPSGSVSGLGTMAVQNSNAISVTGGTVAIGSFGCNGKSPQTAYASGGSVSATGSTQITPYGYTTAAQADGIVTLLNKIQAALVAIGIMS